MRTCPGPRRRRAPRRLQALPRSGRRSLDRGRRDRRASGSAPASCWPRSTTPSCWPSRWPRSTTSPAVGSPSASGSAGTAPRRGTTASTWPARVTRGPRAPGGHGGHLVQEQAEYHGEFVDFGPTWSWPKPVQQPRVRTLVGGGASEAVFAAIVTYADGWIPIGGGGLAEALPRLHALAEKAGRDPAELGVVPFGTIADEAKLEHYARLGIDEVVLRVRAGAERPSGPSSRPWRPSSPSRPHWSNHDRPDRRHDTAAGSTTPLPKIISVDDHIVEPPTCGRPGCRRASGTGAPRWSGAASARWSTSAAAPTGRRSTPTGRRPTAGSTRTSSTSTSATSPPSASTATT